MTGSSQPAAGFLRNVFQVLSGNVVAQAIALGTMPIITRLYSPADFGVFSVIISLLTVLVPISNLRYNAAIPLPGEDADALSLLLLSFLVTGVSAVILAGLIGLWELGLLPVAGGLIPETARGYLWAIPAGILLSSGLLNLNGWAVRCQQFKELARSDIAESAVNRGFVLISGWVMPLGAWGLLIGRLAGMAVGLTYLIHVGLKGMWNRVGRAISFAEIRSLAHRYRNFPLYSTWSGLIIMAAMELPVILMLLLFSPVVSGFYAVGVRIIRFPINMVGNALSRVFFHKAAALKDNEAELADRITEMVAYMVFVGLPGVLVLIFFGDLLFGLVFGDRWTESGVYVQILAPTYLFIFLFRPLVILFTTMERQREHLVFAILLLLVRLIPLWGAAVLFGSAHWAILAMSAATCLGFLAAFVYLFRLLHLSGMTVLRPVCRKVLAWVPLAVGLAALRFIGVNTFWGWIGLVCAVALQAAVIGHTERALKEKGLAWLNRKGRASHV